MTALPTGKLDQIEGHCVVTFSRGVIAEPGAVRAAIGTVGDWSVVDGASSPIRVQSQAGPWRAELSLRDDESGTTITLAHRLETSSDLPEVGPVWDHHLDVLVAVITGADVSAINLKPDYDPGVRAYYEELASTLS